MFRARVMDICVDASIRIVRNLLREMQKVIDPAERLSDTSKAMTDIMDKLIASRGKRSEIPGIVEDNIDCNEGLNKHFGGCEE